MVRSLVDFCVRRSVPVTLLMWTILIGGTIALLTMRREFFPETAPQAARIVLVYPGASPKEIEESMARKIEDEEERADFERKPAFNFNNASKGHRRPSLFRSGR